MRLTTFAKITVALSTIFLLAAPTIGLAASDTPQYKVPELGPTLGLPTSDLQDVTYKAIQLVLGLLALVAVTLIVYGGFVYLTSAGNEESVDKAKKIITAAVIGLVIILLSWAIVRFVLRTTINTVNLTPATQTYP